MFSCTLDVYHNNHTCSHLDSVPYPGALFLILPLGYVLQECEHKIRVHRRTIANRLRTALSFVGVFVCARPKHQFYVIDDELCVNDFCQHAAETS
jgi:hypothetical protein